MAKSFCTGCKHWKRCDFGEFFHDTYFMFCDMLNKYELTERKKHCNGKYYEKKCE
jgi:hypothetical protein